MHNFRFPFYSPLPYRQRNYNQYINTNNISFNNQPSLKIEPNQDYSTQQLNTRFDTSKDDFLFELFGLKIYFDDILILLILLFLYEEGIQDQYLFIALVLLLLS